MKSTFIELIIVLSLLISGIVFASTPTIQITDTYQNYVDGKVITMILQSDPVNIEIELNAFVKIIATSSKENEFVVWDIWVPPTDYSMQILNVILYATETLKIYYNRNWTKSEQHTQYTDKYQFHNSKGVLIQINGDAKIGIITVKINKSLLP